MTGIPDNTALGTVVAELSREQLRRWFMDQGLPAWRGDQVWGWLYARRAASFASMTDLPKALRERLEKQLRLFSTRVAARQTAADGTEKLLLQLGDGQRIECVLLRGERGHRTACISTQVGCPIGCAFCASGLDGLVRNLSAGEIVEQLLHLDRLLEPLERLSHVVVMGIGEPLANLAALLPALRRVAADKGLRIGWRRITISTAGLPEGMRRLAAHRPACHLAVSLHAPDDELRDRLVPVNRRIGIAAILAAADDYFQQTGRRVTYEYVLLAGVNDQPEHARKLAALLQGRAALVNLIPYNPVAGLPFRRPAEQAVAEFAEQLRRGGLNVQVRHRKGHEIHAACGQLRRGLAQDISRLDDLPAG